jgi:uncharacterized Zn-finger protein
MQERLCDGKEACTHRHEVITQADLPLSCPLRDELVWNAHPRVYLPIEEVGQIICPYCGTFYTLKAEVESLPK